MDHHGLANFRLLQTLLFEHWPDSAQGGGGQRDADNEGEGASRSRSHAPAVLSVRQMNQVISELPAWRERRLERSISKPKSSNSATDGIYPRMRWEVIGASRAAAIIHAKLTREEVWSNSPAARTSVSIGK